VVSMKFVKLILIVILLSALTACGTGRINGSLGAFCEGSKLTFDAHVAAMVQHGPMMITTGAGEVLVTGDQLITVYDRSCEK
jgi:hypothetical protein